MPRYTIRQVKQLYSLIKQHIGIKPFTVYDIESIPSIFSYKDIIFLIRKGTYYNYFSYVDQIRINNRNKNDKCNAYRWLNRYVINLKAKGGL
jgi:hypothetical protein